MNNDTNRDTGTDIKEMFHVKHTDSAVPQLPEAFAKRILERIHAPVLAAGTEEDFLLLPSLLEILRTDPDWLKRVKALQTIEKLSGLVPLSALLEALHDREPLVRATAARILGQQQSTSVRAPLHNLLNDSDWHVRESALFALERVEQQQDALEDEQPVIVDLPLAQTLPARLYTGRSRSFMRTLSTLVAVIMLASVALSWFVIANSVNRSPGSVSAPPSALGKPLVADRFKDAFPRDIPWSPDSKYLSYPRTDNSFGVIDIAHKQVVEHKTQDLTMSTYLGRKGGTGTTFIFPNGRYYFANANSVEFARTTFIVLDMQNGKTLLQQNQPWFSDQSEIEAFPSNNSQAIAIISSDGKAKIWDVQQGRNHVTLQANIATDHVPELTRWSPDDTILLTPGSDWQHLQAWNSKTGTLRYTLPAAQTTYSSFSPDGAYLAIITDQSADSVKYDKANLDLYAAATGRLIKHYALPGLSEEFAGRTLRWLPDSRHILTHTAEKARVWDVLNGATALEVSYKPDTWTDLSPDGKYLLVNSPKEQDTLTIWNIQTGRKQAQIRVAGESIVSFSYINGYWSPLHNYLSFSVDNKLYIWDAQTGKLKYEQQLIAVDDKPSVYEEIWSPNGEYVAVRGSLSNWNAQDPASLTTMTVWKVA